MLTGLGRQLRCCGVDVRLVDADTSHETAAAVCLALDLQGYGIIDMRCVKDH